MKNLLSALLLSILLYSISYTQSLNPNFGKSGQTLVNFMERTNDNYSVYGITITDDNNIVLGGDIYSEPVMHKIKPNGRDNFDFANKGFFFPDLGFYQNNRINETLNYPNGKVIGIGHATPVVSFVHEFNVLSAALVVRLLENGQPDPSFGINGKAMYLINHLSLLPLTGVVQSDGKIVVACRGYRDPTAVTFLNRLVVLRFTAGGTVDNSFGSNGALIISQFAAGEPSSGLGQMGIAMQADGKIILGDVSTSGGTMRSAIYRITTDGKMDNSFGIGGMSAHTLGLTGYCINSVLVQPDGKIVAAGNSFSASYTNTWLMFRLKGNGQVDSSFATNGVFTFTNTTWKEHSIGQIKMQGNDRIIAAAYHNTTNYGVVDVFRMKLNGTFDSSFASSSVIHQTDMFPGFIFNNVKLALDQNNGIAALGYTTNFPVRNSTNVGFLIRRLNKDGVSDNSFNTIGTKTYRNNQNIALTTDYNFGSTDKLVGMVRLNSGKIIIGGNIYWNSETLKDVGFSRLTADGKIDSSFGQNGRIRPAGSGSIVAMLKLDDEKILYNQNGNTVIRMDSTGKIDSSFAVNGRAVLPIPSAGGFSTYIKSLAQQADKKIIVLSDKHLFRLNVDGSSDLSFGVSGVVTIPPNYSNVAKMVKVQSDGKIVVGCDYSNSGTLLFRFTSAGLVDNSFGINNNGSAFANVPLSVEPVFKSTFVDFEFQSDGKIVVLCLKDRAFGIPNSLVTDNYRDIILYRLNANGVMDYSFGHVPVQYTYAGTSHLTLPFAEEVPGDLFIYPNDRLAISGYFNRGNGWDIGLIQLKSNGRYDTTCSIRGYTTAGIDNVLQNRWMQGNLELKLAPVPDGSFLVAGTEFGQNADFFVANFSSPDLPMANFATVDATQDTGCLRIKLNWQTDYECSVDSFYVEYSKDNINFSKVGSVLGAGSSSTTISYQYIHSNASVGNNYYRLRLYHNGILYSLSPVKAVTITSLPLAAIDWQSLTEIEKDTTFDAELKWRTQFENGSRNFEIQISYDSIQFSTIKIVPAKGNASAPTDYSTMIQNLPAGKYYFKIRLLGDNCRELSSVVKSVQLEKGCHDAFLIAPNPVFTMLHIEIPLCEKGDLEIFNMLGQLVYKIKNVQQPFVDINCNKFAAATYFVRFAGSKVYTAKFIKL